MLRMLILLIAATFLPGMAFATAIVMDPNPFTLDSPAPGEAHMTWTLLEGTYDPAADITSLLLANSIQQVTHQPNGTIAFDAPIVYAESSTIDFWLFDHDPADPRVWAGDPAAPIVWAEVGFPPPFTVSATLWVELRGIPASATFTMTNGASREISFHAINGDNTAIPEPISLMLFAAGGLVVAAAVRRR